MSLVLWVLLGVLYLTAFIALGLATLRKGHFWLFFLGVFFPVLWIVGALISSPPRQRWRGGPSQTCSDCSAAPARLSSSSALGVSQSNGGII